MAVRLVERKSAKVSYILRDLNIEQNVLRHWVS